MQLKFLGTGSAFNVKRGNNCAYYKEGESILFLDFGESIFEKVVKKNVLSGIKNIFVAITHLHGDHVGSLSTLIYYACFNLNTKVKLLSIGVGNKEDELLAFLKFQGVSEKHFEFVGENLEDKFTQIKNCKYVRVSHSKSLGQCYAVEIEMADKSKIYFSGDTNDQEYIKNVVSSLNKNDEFYCDTCLEDWEGNVHTNYKVLENLVPKEKRKQVYCMHIDDECLPALLKEKGFKVVKQNLKKTSFEVFFEYVVVYYIVGKR